MRRSSKSASASQTAVASATSQRGRRGRVPAWGADLHACHVAVGHGDREQEARVLSAGQVEHDGVTQGAGGAQVIDGGLLDDVDELIGPQLGEVARLRPGPAHPHIHVARPDDHAAPVGRRSTPSYEVAGPIGVRTDPSQAPMKGSRRTRTGHDRPVAAGPPGELAVALRPGVARCVAGHRARVGALLAVAPGRGVPTGPGPGCWPVRRHRQVLTGHPEATSREVTPWTDLSQRRPPGGATGTPRRARAVPGTGTGRRTRRPR